MNFLQIFIIFFNTNIWIIIWNNDKSDDNKNENNSESNNNSNNETIKDKEKETNKDNSDKNNNTKDNDNINHNDFDEILKNSEIKMIEEIFKIQKETLDAVKHPEKQYENFCKDLILLKIIKLPLKLIKKFDEEACLLISQ